MPESYKRFFENNRKWVQDKLKEDRNYFFRLSEGQKPEFFLIGCSDSRVSPNLITGAGPGELFIHRNIANLAVHSDINFLSALQYAVEVLKVKHIIVKGHYYCGGIRAAMSDAYHGLIDNWLMNIRDVMRLHDEELSAIHDDEKRFRKLVELNVLEQVNNVRETSIIQKAKRDGSAPQIHGWVYDLQEGLLKDLHLEQL
jgi:carbonic anhydrase